MYYKLFTTYLRASYIPIYESIEFRSFSLTKNAKSPLVPLEQTSIQL